MADYRILKGELATAPISNSDTELDSRDVFPQGKSQSRITDSFSLVLQKVLQVGFSDSLFTVGFQR